jgi:hypothetical protein
MCQCPHTKEKTFEKKFSLAQFFNDHWDSYIAAPKYYVTKDQLKAVNAIRTCRTDKLGKDVYACKDCGSVVEIYHNCKNRFCSNCSWSDTLKWADSIYKKLLNIPHRHVVMTLPHALNSLIRKNLRFFEGILISAACNTIKEHIINLYGFYPGVIGVLHTFGEKKNLHLHVHMIASWGGMTKDKEQLKQIPVNNYVDYIDLKEIFRKKIVAAIIDSYHNGDLIHDFLNDLEFFNFIKGLNQKHWIIHLEPPMIVPEQVIRYIGRYSKRACLSEHKITNIEGDYISFQYKDYKEKDLNGKPVIKELTLHYRDFFPLLLQHVPLKNFRLVRYYGSYATKTKIDKRFSDKPAPGDSGQKVIEFTSAKVCELCKGEMQYIETEATKGTVQWYIYIKKELSKRSKKIAA